MAHTVVCIANAKPGQEDNLRKALESVVDASRAEASNLEYRLHQDINNPAQFVLYENWVSGEEHAEQFKKPYILALIAKLEDLTAGPAQVIFASELCALNSPHPVSDAVS